jgi:hypothetical protein
MIKEGGRRAVGRDGGETPPLQMHAEVPPPEGVALIQAVALRGSPGRRG